MRDAPEAITPRPDAGENIGVIATVRSDKPYLLPDDRREWIAGRHQRCLPSSDIVLWRASNAREVGLESGLIFGEGNAAYLADDPSVKSPVWPENPDQNIRSRYAPHPAATARHFRYPSAGDCRISAPVLPERQ